MNAKKTKKKFYCDKVVTVDEKVLWLCSALFVRKELLVNLIMHNLPEIG